MRRTPATLGLLVFALAPLLAACSGNGSDDVGEDGTGAVLAFGSGERFSIEAALAQIPAEVSQDDDPAFLQITVADILAGSELAGTSRPTGSTDVDEVADWLQPMLFGDASPVFLPLPTELVRDVTQIEEYRNELGFAISDVDASIEIAAGAASTVVLVGDINPNDATEIAPGITSFGEGDDFETNFDDRTAARSLGRPLRIAEIDDLVLTSRSTPTVSAWLDPTSARLSDDTTLSEMARVLDNTGVVGAAVFRFDFSSPPGSADDGTDPPISTPFDTVAIGWGVDAGNAQITVVYATGSEEAASSAREEVERAFSTDSPGAFGRPITEQLVVERVSADGTLVVATLGLRSDEVRPDVLIQLMNTRAAPFVYGS